MAKRGAIVRCLRRGVRVRVCSAGEGLRQCPKKPPGNRERIFQVMLLVHRVTKAVVTKKPLSVLKAALIF